METPNVVGGRYELLEQIGSSSWRAVDRELEREVLVKLPATVVGHATLSHPSIVQVFDQGVHEGQSYAVFEYAGGGTLAQRLEGGGLDAPTARAVAAEVTAALAYAHAQGIAHGSLSPESVLFDAEGNAKVAGFGGAAEGAAEDREALAALVARLDVEEDAGAAAADVTAVLEPLPSPRRWKPMVLVALGAVALLLVGVAAAMLASGDDGPSSETSTGPATTSTASSEPETQAPVVPPAATTADESTATTATTTAPETSAPETTAPATTAPPPATTAPEPTTEPPPTTVPPPTTEAPPTSEPPPVTTAAPTTG